MSHSLSELNQWQWHASVDRLRVLFLGFYFLKGGARIKISFLMDRDFQTILGMRPKGQLVDTFTIETFANCDGIW